MEPLDYLAIPGAPACRRPSRKAPIVRRYRRLPWPASRITRAELHALWVLGQETGEPITAIVHRAVLAHLARKDETRGCVGNYGAGTPD